MWDKLVSGISGGAIGGVMDMINNNQNMKNQRELMDIANKHTKEQTAFNKAKQLEMWKETNAPAQREMLEKAGLNVGLMYGGSGAGGSTATNLATGSAGTPSAPQMGNNKLMAIEAMKNLELLDAQVKKTEAEADSIQTNTGITKEFGMERAEEEINVMRQNVKSERAKQTLNEIETEIKGIEASFQGETLGHAIDKFKYTTQKIQYEMQILGYEEKVSKATTETRINTMKQQLSGIMLDNTLKRWDIKMKPKELEMVTQQILSIQHDRQHKNKMSHIELEKVINGIHDISIKEQLLQLQNKKQEWEELMEVANAIRGGR